MYHIMLARISRSDWLEDAIALWADLRSAVPDNAIDALSEICCAFSF